MRDLTRYRSAVTADRSRDKQRLAKVLEDAGIKLSIVATDILGVSGRAMLQALIAGERDPNVLADLARARMRSKLPELRQALVGRFNEHHAFLCQVILDRIDAATASIATLTAKIEAELAPWQEAAERLATIPGVGTRLAQVLIAETGGDMSRFATAGHLASWAGMCPGNNESAGKQYSGHTRQGNSWLRAALGEAAIAVTRSKNNYLIARYKRLAARRGRKRALVAVGHSILIALWHMLTNNVNYQDLGPDYFLSRLDRTRTTRRLLDQLQRLGYQAQLTPLPGG